MAAQQVLGLRQVAEQVEVAQTLELRYGEGWPHTPPNYVGFRFDGWLQQVRHVDDYDVITRPHEHIPEVIPEADWSDEPHFLYTLGPPIVPAKPVLNGKIWPNAGCGARSTCC